jgi:nudix-type nucleoside diphosphatase (YffH/AdpP family)
MMPLTRQLKYNGYIQIEELTIQTTGGKQIQREEMKKKNAAAALVYNTATGQYIFTSQWRPGAEAELLEIPAGVLDKPNETPEACITREVEEETGYKVDSLQFIAEGYVSPGASTEIISVYLARVSAQTGAGGGVESEDEEITIVELSRNQMLATAFKDFKSIIAVQWARYNAH